MSPQVRSPTLSLGDFFGRLSLPTLSSRLSEALAPSWQKRVYVPWVANCIAYCPVFAPTDGSLGSAAAWGAASLTLRLVPKPLITAKDQLGDTK